MTPRPPTTPISPDELKVAAAEYAATGSYAAAARAIGRDKSATRKALRRASEPLRATLHARALEDAFSEATKAVRLTARQLRQDARTARRPGDRANTAFALSDAARTLTQMRTAHAKLTGEHAPEKHQVDVRQLSDDDLDAELRRLAALSGGEGANAPDPAGEGTESGGASQDPGQDPEP